jgi:hypothetical protein
VEQWLEENEACGQFTCPSTFQLGTHSRCNETVVQRRFLVVESDVLDKDQMSSVINWCRQFLRLRAIIDTGGQFYPTLDARPRDRLHWTPRYSNRLSHAGFRALGPKKARSARRCFIWTWRAIEHGR